MNPNHSSMQTSDQKQPDKAQKMGLINEVAVDSIVAGAMMNETQISNCQSKKG